MLAYTFANFSTIEKKDSKDIVLENHNNFFSFD